MRTTFLIAINIILVLLFSSCRKKVYREFTEEEEAFLVYDMGETFRLRNENTGDTIEYMVTDKYLRFKEEKVDLSLFTKKYHHEGRIDFTPSNGISPGIIYLYKASPTDFQLSIDIYTNKIGFGGGDHDFELLPTLDVNGTTYTTVFKFYGGNNTITYFNQTYGFLKLEYPDSNWVYTRVP